MLSHEFAKFVVDVFRGMNSVVDPTSLKKAFEEIQHQFEGFDQHDGEEFLTAFLDCLHSELLDESNHSDSLITRTFQGKFKSSLVCHRCHNTSNISTSFLTLTLPIDDADENPDISTCLESFLSPEILDGDSRWFCYDCKTYVKAFKTFSLLSIPDYLTIHLKRFKYVGNQPGSYNGSVKLSQTVSFPLDGLDLSTFMTASSNICGAEFDLYGSICHIGNIDSGHYASFTKHYKTELWSLFDDAKVTTEKPVGKNEDNTYLLFYKRKFKETCEVDMECSQFEATCSSGKIYDTEQALKWLNSNKDTYGNNVIEPYFVNPYLQRLFKETQPFDIDIQEDAKVTFIFQSNDYMNMFLNTVRGQGLQRTNGVSLQGLPGASVKEKLIEWLKKVTVGDSNL